MGQDRYKGVIMNDHEKSPSEQSHEVLHYLKLLKEARLSEVDELTHAIEVAQAAERYWTSANPQTFLNNPTGGTAVAVLNSFHQQATGLYQSAQMSLLSVRSLSTSADAYGTVTVSAYHMVTPVPTFNPGGMYEIMERPNRDEAYAHKYEVFDPELGKIYRQILQIMSRTTSYPEKSVLPDIRQAFDHLLEKLVPDKEEVRRQPWWPSWSPNEKDPTDVTRRQRLRYAVEKHVNDATLHDTLLANGAHILTVYVQLSGLYHTREPINTDQAHVVSRDMLAYLNLWADALGLSL